MHDVDLIFKEAIADYENGNTLVVQTVFERVGDETIYIPSPFHTSAVQ
jgi:hypothetical protein